MPVTYYSLVTFGGPEGQERKSGGCLGKGSGVIDTTGQHANLIQSGEDGSIGVGLAPGWQIVPVPSDGEFTPSLT